MDTLSIILYILVFAGIIYYYYNKLQQYKSEKSGQTWPLNINPCPDYWTNTKDGKCVNKFNIGRCPMKDDGSFMRDGTVDTSLWDMEKPKLAPDLADDPAMVEEANKKHEQAVNLKKCKWTKKCGVSWEGIDSLCA